MADRMSSFDTSSSKVSIPELTKGDIAMNWKKIWIWINSGDLNTKLVWYSNGQKLTDCWMVQYSGDPKSDNSKTGIIRKPDILGVIFWMVNDKMVDILSKPFKTRTF